MYVTTSYIGTRLGDMKYLFFLLTEDYIESNKRISESLDPLLTIFARDIGNKGALVKPFQGYERSTFGNAVEKNWGHDRIMMMRTTLPALLVINTDFDDFDPRNCNYLYISLRDSIDEYGNVKVFQLQELLEQLDSGVWINNLFQVAHQYLRKQKLQEGWEAIELKPEIFGCSLDLKKAIELFRSINDMRKMHDKS